jgi:4-alpha-glucanotransferase
MNARAPASGPPLPRRRAAGLLLHPTSLPGRFGIGDLGPAAHRFVDFLEYAGQRRWQMLPLGPTGFGDSPYQSFSSFAGNHYLISPEALAADGLLDRADLDGVPAFPADTVDFGSVIAWKLALLDRAFERFESGRAPALREALERFAAEQASWLEDYALFMALKERLGRAWPEWDRGLALREPAALAEARTSLARPIAAQRFRQLLFHRQWSALRERAHDAGVRLIGDLPIFVALDSADVWARRDLFELDDAGQPTVVAGVPPDYFSPTGQRWGNPLYRWSEHARTGYAWWIERLRALFAQVDFVRVDHFRGFESYWEIPADAPTAETGRWVKGPGRALFDAVRGALGDLPILAEDLGEMTPEVYALRDALGLPGMKILQFAWGGGPDDPFLPHQFTREVVVYTGTHDNDTTRGWYAQARDDERHYARRYLRVDGTDFTWDLIRAAFASVADLAIVPVQDVLDLGGEARMNLPGRMEGNWGWRFREGALAAAHAERLRELVELYGR